MLTEREEIVRLLADIHSYMETSGRMIFGFKVKLIDFAFSKKVCNQQKRDGRFKNYAQA